MRRIFRDLRNGSICLCCLALSLAPAAPAASSQTAQAVASETQAKATSLPPFDRLELLASVTANFYTPYLLAKIRQRRIDFVPDPAFLAAVRRRNSRTDVLETLNALKPQQDHAAPPDRQKAYAILLELIAGQGDRSVDDTYQAAIALAPDSAALHLAYAEHLLLIQNYPAAEVQARRSLELWPGDADAHIELATALTGQDRDEEAVPEAREALRIFPEDKAALVELGMALTRSRQFKDAVPVLRQAISRTPGMSLLHKHLGLSLFNTGDIEGAIAEYVTFLQTNPDDAEGHYHLGAAFRSQGRNDDAQAQFREAARLDPSNPVLAAAADPSAAQKGPQAAAGQRPDDGSVDRNVYTNRFFSSLLKNSRLLQLF